MLTLKVYHHQGKGCVMEADFDTVIVLMGDILNLVREMGQIVASTAEVR